MRVIAVFWLAAAAAVAACGSPDAQAEAPGGRVVDSLLPREVALRRFRQGLTPVESLAGGAGSLDGLVTAYLRALSEGDSATLTALAVTRAEFAYLYYPTAVQARPPYDLEPGLMWFMLFERSNQGLRRALQVLGGRPVRPAGHDCGAGPQREGQNLVHGPCEVRWVTQEGDTTAAQLFSRILERDGRFKFLSYASRIDSPHRDRGGPACGVRCP
jgi:hypothetical protein